ncbi:MAG: FkbM family methyltransferase [bacterium]
MDETVKPIVVRENRPIGNVKLLLEDISDRGVKFKYILDVGANLGEWTRMAKEVFPESLIYMIEPLSEMESNLNKVSEDFPGTKYFPVGAGSKIENHVMTTWSNDLAGANCLVQENEYLKSINKQRIIPIITIDSLIDNGEIEMPELVKMDIQGFELEALKGATKLFGNTEVFILEASLFEFTAGNPILSEVVIFMAEKGYEIYDFPGFLRRPFDGALGQIDVCFAKRNGLLRSSNAWVQT